MRSGTQGKALSVITLVGCGLSIVGLLLTMCVHLYFRRLRASPASQILLNLCVALLIALVVFVLASQAGGRPDACRVWAIGLP